LFLLHNIREKFKNAVAVMLINQKTQKGTESVSKCISLNKLADLAILDTY
jgi:hypothetical protein